MTARSSKDGRRGRTSLHASIWTTASSRVSMTQALPTEAGDGGPLADACVRLNGPRRCFPDTPPAGSSASLNPHFACEGCTEDQIRAWSTASSSNFGLVFLRATQPFPDPRDVRWRSSGCGPFRFAISPEGLAQDCEAIIRRDEGWRSGGELRRRDVVALYRHVGGASARGRHAIAAWWLEIRRSNDPGAERLIAEVLSAEVGHG